MSKGHENVHARTHTHNRSPLHSVSPTHPVQPFIRDPPVNLTVNQSSPATFSCIAQGNPVPTISWTGPSASFTTEVTPGANFTVLSVLTIDSAVRALHEGAYTCSASNGVGPSPNSSAALTVQGTAGDTSTTQHQMHCRPATPSQLHHIALQVSAHQETMYYNPQSCCDILFHSVFLPQFPPLCKLSGEGLWVFRT